MKLEQLMKTIDSAKINDESKKVYLILLAKAKLSMTNYEFEEVCKKLEETIKKEERTLN